MSEPDHAEAEITLEAGDFVLKLGEALLTPGQVKHIIVNHDTNGDDAVLGSVVIETVPPYSTGTEGDAPGMNQLQVDVFNDEALANIERFSTANNISVTNTSLDNERFHKTFWADAVI